VSGQNRLMIRPTKPTLAFSFVLSLSFLRFLYHTTDSYLAYYKKFWNRETKGPNVVDLLVYCLIKIDNDNETTVPAAVCLGSQ
jgi:hypothetical protein